MAAEAQQQGTPPGSATRRGSFFQRLSPLMGRKDSPAPQKVGTLGRLFLPAAAACVQRMLNKLVMRPQLVSGADPSISRNRVGAPHASLRHLMFSLWLALEHPEGVQSHGLHSQVDLDARVTPHKGPVEPSPRRGFAKLSPARWGWGKGSNKAAARALAAETCSPLRDGASAMSHAEGGSAPMPRGRRRLSPKKMSPWLGK